MTGLLFGSILIGVIVCWVALVLAEPAGVVRRIVVVALAFAPVLLFSSVVLAAFLSAPAGDYRVALEAVSFQLIDDAVTVGGASEASDADDFIVHDLPSHYLTFRQDGDSVVVELPADLSQDEEEPVYAAVRVDDAKPFANSVLVEDDTKIGAQRFNRSERKLEGTFPAIPTRRQEIFGDLSIPILRNLTAETSMFPLRFWARPNGTDAPAEDANGAPLGSFFSFEGGLLRRSLFLTLTGDGTSVKTNGTTTTYQRKLATIAPGTSKHFALYRLDYADPARAADARSAAQERRSFRATFKDGRLSLVFDTPDVYRLSSASVAEVLAKQKDNDAFLLTTRDPGRNAPITASQMVLSFRQLGPRLQNEFYSAIRIANVKDCEMRVTTHMGTRCHALGDAFTIGDSAATILRITQMTIPWGIMLAMLALALLAIGWPGGDQHPVAAILISASEVFLAIRLLIAFEGGILDSTSAPALWQSLVAFAVLPLALRLAWLYRVYRESQAAPGRDLIEAIVRVLVVALIVGIALWHARVPLLWIAAGAALLLIAIALVIVLTHWIIRHFATEASLGKLLLFAAVTAAVRIAMWLGPGWKERITIAGSDLAITVIYLPVVFLFFALLWRRFAVAGASPLTLWGWLAVLGAIVLGGVLMGVLPYLVRDSGSAFVHVPAILLLFALPMLSRRPTVRTAGAGIFLVLLILGHTIALFLPHMRSVEKVADPQKSEEYLAALSSEAEAIKFLEVRLRASTNELRVKSHVSPHQVEAAGTSKAEGLVAQRRMLDRYSGRGYLGAGYLNVPLAVFRDTHLNDNLSALHILAPFGLIGATGVVGLLLGLALLPAYAILRQRIAAGDTPEDAIDASNALGFLCIWTIAVAGIYMFAANVGLVLFTGKNVYLLAAASKSDVAEGGVLLLVALLALHEPAAKETP